MNKKKVLIVDDEPAIGAMVKEYLEGLGVFEVKVETKAQTACESAKQFAPSLILLDEMMPDMSGSEVFHQLKKDPKLKKTPVIFLTGIVSHSEVEDEGGEIGGRVFISKPIHLQRLADLIEKHHNV